MRIDDSKVKLITKDVFLNFMYLVNLKICF